MKTKLLGVVAASVLALTVGAAKADTYTVVGTFGPGSDSSHCGGFAVPFNVDICGNSWPGGTLSGTLTIANNSVIAENITVQIGAPMTGLLIPPSYDFANLARAQWFQSESELFSQEGSAGIQLFSLLISFDLAHGTFASSYRYEFDFAGNGVDFTSAAWSGSGTFTVTTPLPAALPLFATGLGALGLLGWRGSGRQCHENETVGRGCGLCACANRAGQGQHVSSVRRVLWF
jgi:hypothetical protein